MELTSVIKKDHVMSIVDDLRFVKFPVLDHGYICLVDAMGDDSSIVQAARVSYGLDLKDSTSDKDRNLIRYLMNHKHSTPLEMVEIKFMIQAPMDCWRQWVRHRTANINEYSTRYTEAIHIQQATLPGEWRLQATDNKQGSSGTIQDEAQQEELRFSEERLHEHARAVYNRRLTLGVAKEQARKDLPLSTYTRAYWKCDLHNIFNFLRLRMDSHAQLEIRSYANAMYEIVKQIVPVACEAFEDYVLNARSFSAEEMRVLRRVFANWSVDSNVLSHMPMDLSKREKEEFIKKVGAQ